MEQRGFRSKAGRRGVKGEQRGRAGQLCSRASHPLGALFGKIPCRGIVVVEGYPRPLPTGCPQGADTPQHLPALHVPGVWRGRGQCCTLSSL